MILREKRRYVMDLQSKRYYAAFIDFIVSLVLGIALGILSSIPVMGLIVMFVYYILMEASPLQASVGKLVMKIKVVDSERKRIKNYIAFLRCVGRVIVIASGGYMNRKYVKEKGVFFTDYFSGSLVISD